VRINIVLLALLVCLGLGKAETSEAFGCHVNDDATWGIGTSFQQTNANTFRTTAVTHVDHVLDHPNCSGLLWAKPTLLGLLSGSSCSSMAGLNHTSAATSTKSFDADCSGLPCNRTYHGGGEHWWQSTDAPDDTHEFTESGNSIYFPCSGPEPSPDCATVYGPDYWWDGLECTNQVTPIIIAIGRRANYQLTAAQNGVSFDLDADGQAEVIGWTRADSDVALLAIDRNGDGRITSGQELFGNHTVPGALNGFEALARMDYELSGIVRTAIHRGDELFDQLLLWTDRNHNGISEPNELVPARDVLSEISFEYEPSQRRDQFGNLYRFKGQATIGATTRPIWDVLFTEGS
jgi:hypothetical protein